MPLSDETKGSSEQNSNKRPKLRKASNAVQFLTMQWVLIVMFAGVIGVGVWHGMVTDENNRLIRESIRIIKQNRGEK